MPSSYKSDEVIPSEAIKRETESVTLNQGITCDERYELKPRLPFNRQK